MHLKWQWWVTSLAELMVDGAQKVLQWRPRRGIFHYLNQILSTFKA